MDVLGSTLGISVAVSLLFIGVNFLLFFLIFFLFVQRLVKFVRRYFATKAFQADKDTILQVIENGTIDTLTSVKKPNYLHRNFLVLLAETVSGDMLDKIREIYSYLGFQKIDNSHVVSFSLRKSAEALARLRSLQYDLPEHVWIQLLNAHLLEFRWASMEYAISVKQQNSLFLLISFLTSKDNLHEGNLYHLFSCFAKYNAKALVFILENSEDDLLNEVILSTLIAYPVPGSEETIWASFNVDSNDRHIVSAFGALAVHGGEYCEEKVLLFVDHPSWEVRVAIINYLKSRGRGFNLIETFLLDGSFNVQSSAQQALVDLLPATLTICESICTDREHPSFEFIKHYLSEQVAS